MSTSPGLPGIYCSSLIQVKGMSLPSLQEEEELSPTDCSEDSVEIKPRPILFNKTLRLRPFPPMLTETAYGSCPTGSSTTSSPSKRKLQSEELRRPVCEEKKRRISGSEEEEIPLSPMTPKPLTAIGDLFLPSPSPPTTAYLPPGYIVPHPHHFPLASLLRFTPTNTQSCLPTTNADYLTTHDHEQRALVNQYVLARLNASLPWPPSAAYARHPFPPLAPNLYHPHALGYLHPPFSHGMGLYPPLPNLYNNSTGVSFIPPPSPTQPHNPHHFPLPNHLPMLNPSLIKHPLTQNYHPPVPSSLREDTHKDLNLRTAPCSPQLSPTVSRPPKVPSPKPLPQPLSLVKQSVSLSSIQCEVVQEDQRVKPGEPSVEQNPATSTPVPSISRKFRKERKTSKLSVKPSNEVIKEVDTQRFTREDKSTSKPEEVPNTSCSTLLLPVKKRSAFFSVETLLGNDSSATKLETAVKEEPGTLPPRPPSAAASTSAEQFVAHAHNVVPTNIPSPRAASPDGRTKHRNYKNMTRERRMEANARERTRVHTISAAFENLRRAVPSFSHGQRLSKLSILRVAASYILALSKLSTDSEGDTSSETDALPSLASCVDLCTRTLTTEGQLRRKREDRTNEDSDDDL